MSDFYNQVAIICEIRAIVTKEKPNLSTARAINGMSQLSGTINEHGGKLTHRMKYANAGRTTHDVLQNHVAPMIKKRSLLALKILIPKLHAQNLELTCFNGEKKNILRERVC